MANELKPGEAAMQATIQITRAATGKVETYNLTFTPIKEDGQDVQEVEPKGGK